MTPPGTWIPKPTDQPDPTPPAVPEPVQPGPEVSVPDAPIDPPRAGQAKSMIERISIYAYAPDHNLVTGALRT
jgi:hypothetical protein